MISEIIRQYATPQWKIIFKTASAGTVNRFITIIIGLVSIPLVVKYLGNDKYGFWITISSLGAYLRLLEFGIGPTMLNILTEAKANNDRIKFNRIIGNGLFFSSLIMIVISIAFSFIWPAINLISVFKVTTVDHNQAKVILMIFMISVLLSVILSIFQKIPYTIHKGYITEVHSIIASITCFLLIIYAIFANLGIIILITILCLPQIIACLGVYIHLKVTKEISLKMRDFIPEKSIVKTLKMNSVYLSLFQVCMVIISSSGFILLAYFRGAESVAPFGIMFQIYMAIHAPIFVLQPPLWTILAKEAVTNNMNSIKNIIFQHMKISFGYSLFLVFFFIFLSGYLINIVLGKQIIISSDLKYAFAILSLLSSSVGIGMVTIILALGLTRQNALISIAQTIVFLFVALILTPKYGATGVVWSSVSTYIVTIPSSFWLLKRYIFDSHLKK